MIILILVTLLTTVFLELIWWSAQTVNGIEASNAAYYQAVGIVEEQLINPSVTKKTPWNIQEKTEPFTNTGRSIDVSTGSIVMPEATKWNSPYDDNYNIIALGKPLQIVILDGIDWTNVAFEFRVPQIDTSVGTWVAASLANSGIVLWTLGYTWASLYASGETQIFQGNDINTVTNQFLSFTGNTNSWTSMSVNTFYNDSTNTYLWTSGARCANYACTLKLSMIRPIVTTDWRILPFLEYRIVFNKAIPSQFMTIDATAYSYGFQRTRTIRIPQVTTNTALDFAVLQ
jgi:hypothetical protein